MPAILMAAAANAQGPIVETSAAGLMTGVTPTSRVLQLTGPSGQNTEAFWKRYSSGGVLDIGNIWCTGGGNNFTVQAMNTSGSLFLRNAAAGAIKLLPQQPFTIGTGASTFTFTAKGYVGLGMTSTFNSSGTSAAAPWARLHLVDDTPSDAQANSCRDWMRNGVLMTGNNDQMYVGQKAGASDYTDAVIQWSDNPGTASGDRMRFIFTKAQVSGIPSGALSHEGMEAMRIYPLDEKDANVGIGDFYYGGDDPTERLDIRTGRLRIRDLPGETEDLLSKKVMVVDANGVVHWRNESYFLDAVDDCDWELDATGHDVYTAWQPSGANGTCPEEDNKVGIGTNAPAAKLHVSTNDFDVAGLFDQSRTDGGSTRGVVATSTGSLLNNTAVWAGATSAGAGCQENWGGNFYAAGAAVRSRGLNVWASGGSYTSGAGDFYNYGNAQWAWGIAGVSDSGYVESTGVDGSVSANAAYNNYGVRGGAAAPPASANMVAQKFHGVYGSVNVLDNDLDFGFGVHGYANEPMDTTTDANGLSAWAGYFEGPTYSPGSAWTASDANLKKDIKELSGAEALKKIKALSPKTYTFDTDKYGFMSLPRGPQLGLISQEVEKVLPELVSRTTRPADLDSTGNIVHDAVEFKAMQYQGLIPVLVAGMKEQQRTIEQQQETMDRLLGRMEEMEREMEQLRAGTGESTSSDAVSGPSLSVNDLRIAPNPFSDRATITYTVNCDCRVRVDVTTADGKPLVTLVDERLSTGRYSYELSTSTMAAGVYYCMLLVDGLPTAKQAVKVTR